jgi:hypothetical protein
MKWRALMESIVPAEAKSVRLDKTVVNGQAYHAPLKYEGWQIHPQIPGTLFLSRSSLVMSELLTTKHEGDVLYYKLWNFWVRARRKANPQPSVYFRDYDTPDPDVDALVKVVGLSRSQLKTEEDVWGRIGTVWNWMKNKVQDNSAEYETISSDPNEWPSIIDYARYYKANQHLVWAACFSKAHIFATLLGKVIPRSRVAIAQGHHAENGAPPTASHVFVAVYVADRWFYLDPTAIYTAFPTFAQRQSIGVTTFKTVDYEHPYSLISVPLSDVTFIPHLPK